MFSGLHQFGQSVLNRLVEFFDCRPKVFRLPRSSCHRIVMDVQGIPKRLYASTIQLHIEHLTGSDAIGFLWKVEKGVAEIWYWHEGESLREKVNASKDEYSARVIICPENLLRTKLSDGMHLVACDSGFEALAIEGGRINKTRWFLGMPSENEWRVFLRDAGQRLAGVSCPVPATIPVSEQFPREWKCQTGLSKQLPPFFIPVVAIITLIICFAVTASVCSAKLFWLVAETGLEYQQLRRKHADLVELGKKLEEDKNYLNLLASVKEVDSQITLMAKLVEAGVFNDEHSVSLLEWEYKDGRLRMLFSIPERDFSHSLFLTALENIGVFGSLKLISDVQPKTMGVQTTIINRRGDSTELSDRSGWAN